MDRLQHYSIPQVAIIFGVSVPTVRRMIAAGNLETWQVGRRLRIPVAEAERLCQQIIRGETPQTATATG